jgi:NAD(P)H-dependent nitrite reductase large subunit/NAD(P)H-dependent nitrite reductase small subunit
VIAANFARKTIVVIGNGMVGHRFCERLVEFDTAHQFRVVTFCEEPRAAYDRVGLTSFFAHRDAEQLMLARKEWYLEHGVELHIGDRACELNRETKTVRSQKGVQIDYDICVMATGSYPFVPSIPGIQNRGVFVYRTIEDLNHIIEYSQQAKRCAVIGGGLLGLEAAKAAYDLGLETHVVVLGPRVLARQLDDKASKTLVSKIETLGIHVHLDADTTEVLGNGQVEGLQFKDSSKLAVDMVVVSAGIVPRDDLAKASGLKVGPRGGVVVDDQLRTSDPDIFAIGEVALHRSMVYGLVAPGYEMAEIVAANLCGQSRAFNGADMSTKLKLTGVDVASFGNHEADATQAKAIVFEDPFEGVYKKILVSLDGKKLLGGILVGDANDYGRLLMTCKSDKPLTVWPSELLLGPKGGASSSGVGDLDPTAQICSCNNVLMANLCTAIAGGVCTVGELKSCTRAGTGCGGCIPLVTDILNSELKKAGKTVNTSLCEHFAFTRQELFHVIKIKGYRTFSEVVQEQGVGHGCEICKPAVASILASLWNEDILEQATVQDTNDRFLANIQRGGSYSVVPRVPGGEITPEKLIVLGEVGRKYNLYTKITGGQRIDLFGAEVHQLPSIWEELVNAGFESGHAYGKSLRTVKSCVGSTWCRFGVQDSVGFAIRIENRYKGLRSPHKLKGAVSGCVRECAEAQSKDFGLIATEAGYNLYVCGNGGSKPRHADLLAADLDEETATRYIDRFLMYYVQTADRLTRTSVWLEKLEGGLEHLRDVIIRDKLGLCEDLDRQMQFVVDTYQCEWAAVVRDPEKRRLFQQFVNTDETEPTIEFVSERGQPHPAPWLDDTVPLGQLTLLNGKTLDETTEEAEPTWVRVGSASEFPVNGGATIKHGHAQIAVFNFDSRQEWYATDNMCPHKQEFALSRGIIGDVGGVPKVACPFHKKNFSLQDGSCLSGEDYSIRTYPVRLQDDDVFLLLPHADALATVPAIEQRLCGTACTTCAPA